MAYDSQRGRTLLWGGEDFSFALVRSVWEWDGSQWHNPQPAVVPPGRLGHAMCFDAARGVIVLFGGTDWTVDFGDHWEWNGTTWTQRTPAQLPGARGHHAMTYDAGRQRCVLFGGEDGLGLLGETWEFDGAVWSNRQLQGGPSPRTSPALEYDPARARCILFGGADTVLDLDDTWEFDGSTWFQVATGAVPPRNVASASAFDAVRGRMVVSGGFGPAGALGATHEYGGQDASYRTYGIGCDGSNGLPPRLAATAMPQLGQAIALQITDLPTNGGPVLLATALSRTSWSGRPDDVRTAGLLRLHLGRRRLAAGREWRRGAVRLRAAGQPRVRRRRVPAPGAVARQRRRAAGRGCGQQRRRSDAAVIHRPATGAPRGWIPWRPSPCRRRSPSPRARVRWSPAWQ
jgi:hypothetical protein